MNAGKTLFSQLMDCLPWSTFARIVARYHGDHSVQTFPCTEQYRAMAFAQLTYRESLRDIEACLASQPAKLWHMGFGGPVRRSTLADANEVRDWRIYAEFAQRLIAQARRLYVDESLLGDLDSTVYALDSTTIDLCLSLFPWAHFRSTKAAVKMHTLLDLRGNIPSFIHISNGKLHDVHALDMLVPEAGAIYVMDRDYVDFARLHGLHQAGAFFVTRAVTGQVSWDRSSCREVADQVLGVSHEALDDTPSSFVGGSDEGSDHGEILRPLDRAKAAGDFLLELHHAAVTLSLVIGERHLRIGQEAQRGSFVVTQAQHEIVPDTALGAAFAGGAIPLQLGRKWHHRVMEFHAVSDDCVVAPFDESDQMVIGHLVSVTRQMFDMAGAAQQDRHLA